MNEWKAIKFAFKRTPRTEDLFLIIDQYENANAAYEGGNDGPFERSILTRFNGPARRQIFSPPSGSAVIINEGGSIDAIVVDKLEDGDILDLSYLPRCMTEFASGEGNLTGIDLSKLPRGLERLSLAGNQISKINFKCTPPSLKRVMLWRNPVEEKGITLHLPLPQGLVMILPKISCLDLNGGQEHPTDDKGNWEVNWADGTQIKVDAAPEVVKFDFHSK